MNTINASSIIKRMKETTDEDEGPSLPAIQAARIACLK